MMSYVRHADISNLDDAAVHVDVGLALWGDPVARIDPLAVVEPGDVRFRHGHQTAFQLDVGAFVHRFCLGPLGECRRDAFQDVHEGRHPGQRATGRNGRVGSITPSWTRIRPHF